MLKKILKKIAPKNFLLFYHKVLAYLAALFYGWPSEKMVVIGVTGTAGKSTVVNLIGRILEEAGYKVGWATTFNFKIGEQEWFNKTKMTMLGRFGLQKMLRQMLQASCDYAVVETSSEGLAQSRHLGINYDVAVFTNLFPEHLEAHGGFENYKKTKGKLFKKLKIKNKKSKTQMKNKKISIINLDDENADYFLSFPADEKYGFRIKNPACRQAGQESRIKNQEIKIIEAENIQLEPEGSKFMIHNSLFKIHLLGKFNVYNALAAITAAISQGVDLEICQKSLGKIRVIAGRLEEINEGQNFKVFVDYAHTPDSLEKVYQLASSIKYPGSRIIAVLGACGGGRDKWKRPVLGELASRYTNIVIVTNEDPYDDDPKQIIEEVAAGTKNGEDYKMKELYTILDRGEAIKKAIELAKQNDIVIITGKGCEPWIMGPEGTKIPWDDREAVRKFLKEI